MTENELLLEMSIMIDKKLRPMQEDIRMLKEDNKMLKKAVRILELQNGHDIVMPSLQNTESCHTSMDRRYNRDMAQMEAMRADLDIMNAVLKEHSEKLQEIS